ncbi:hypothetical protein Mapa_006286 [Marchantia paleacea]|nr:hypothetical protein Mapa_006286 [Marchantia paleacea]
MPNLMQVSAEEGFMNTNVYDQSFCDCSSSLACTCCAGAEAQYHCLRGGDPAQCCMCP